ncbi:MAG: hypothetical protein ACRC5H_03935 [Treponemataceae bacterium]
MAIDDKKEVDKYTVSHCYNFERVVVKITLIETDRRSSMRSVMQMVMFFHFFMGSKTFKKMFARFMSFCAKKKGNKERSDYMDSLSKSV